MKKLLFLLTILFVSVFNINAQDSIKAPSSLYKMLEQKEKEIEFLKKEKLDSVNGRILFFQKILKEKEEEIKNLKTQVAEKRDDENRQYFYYRKNQWIPVYETIYKKTPFVINIIDTVLNDKIADAQKSLETKTKEIETKNKELTDLGNKINDSSSKNQELKAINDKIADAQKSLETKTKEIETKNKELEILNSKIAVKISANDTIVSYKKIKETRSITEFRVSGVNREDVDSMKNILEKNPTINEDFEYSEKKREEEVFFYAKNIENFCIVEASFTDKDEILCLVLINQNEDNSTEIIGLFNNNGKISFPIEKDKYTLRVCSFVKERKEQKFSYKKIVTKKN